MTAESALGLGFRSNDFNGASDQPTEEGLLKPVTLEGAGPHQHSGNGDLLNGPRLQGKKQCSLEYPSDDGMGMCS